MERRSAQVKIQRLSFFSLVLAAAFKALEVVEDLGRF
jgi:hypothetical protein